MNDLDDHAAPRQASTHPRRFRSRIRQSRQRYRQESDSGLNIRNLVIGNTIGAFVGVIVGEITKEHIFGE